MTWRARNRDRVTVRLDENGQPYDGPTFTLDRQVKQAREEMGAEKWERLNREFEA
jgi:hypothetical protein